MSNPKTLTVTTPLISHESPLILGESPIYRASDNTLHYLDIEAQPHSMLYVAYLASDGMSVKSRQEVLLPCTVSAIVFNPMDSKSDEYTYLCATGQGVACLSSSGKLLPIDIPGIPALISDDDANSGKMRMNDGALDSHGRFWFSSMHKGGDEKGKLYVFDPRTDTLETKEEGFAVGNGPTFSPSTTTLYFNFTSSRITYAHDYDPSTAALSNKRVFVDWSKRSLPDSALGNLVGEGYPDGMCVDPKGNVYIAAFSRSRVEAFRPSGEHFLTIKLPARCVTRPVLGGPDGQTLYISTGIEALLPGERVLGGDLGGNVFAVRVPDQ